MLTSIVTFLMGIVTKIIAFFVHLTFGHFIVLLFGIILPVLIGLVLTRRKTIQYGMFINKFVGAILLQKRLFGKIPEPEKSFLQTMIENFQTTLQDISYGIYIDSRKDITDEDKQKKINEYLGVK